jgi:hypothetical protein
MARRLNWIAAALTLAILLAASVSPALARDESERPELKVELVGLPLAAAQRDVKLRVTNTSAWWANETKLKVETVSPTTGNAKTFDVENLDPGQSATFTYTLAAPCDGQVVKAQVTAGKNYAGVPEANLANNTVQAQACPPKTQPKPQPASKPQAAPSSQPAAKPQAASAPQPASKPQPASAPQPAAKPRAALLTVPSEECADFEKPEVTPSRPDTGSTPKGIVVNWKHSGQGVYSFTVERENPPAHTPGVNATQRQLPDYNLEPNTTYRYRVIAHFITEDGDYACSDWAEGKTSPPEAQQQPQRPPTPRIVEHHAGETWIGIKWEAGFNYESYFINITGPFGTEKGPSELRTIHHDDDGTWGYQRVDGLLPGRTYTFSVQGCTKPVFGIADIFGVDNDTCWDWSPGYLASTSAYSAHSGPDTCAPPFVWREAFPNDHVCVEAQRREQVAADNAKAQERRDYVCTPPNCMFTAPDTCKVGYVWREARPNDLVCVTVDERSRVADENAIADQRRLTPGAKPAPAPVPDALADPDSTYLQPARPR